MREAAGAILAWGDMPEPPLERLTLEPEKAARYGADPLAREGWATLVGVLGAEEALRFATETALLWLRPDVFAAGSARPVLERIAQDGFVTVGAAPARLEPGGVRALWWWQLKRATAERLMLLDAVVGLGPGLVVLYRHPQPDPTRRLTYLKGGNDPAGRAPDSLRSLAGSPNRLLTMVHTSDDPLYVVRELAVFLGWRARAELIASAHASLGSPSVVGGPLATLEAAYRDFADAPAGSGRIPRQRGEAFAALAAAIEDPHPARRWAAVRDWSTRVPLLNGRV